METIVIALIISISVAIIAIWYASSKFSPALIFQSYKFIETDVAICDWQPIKGYDLIQTGANLVAADGSIIIPATGKYRIAVAVNQCGCPAPTAGARLNVNGVQVAQFTMLKPGVQFGCDSAIVFDTFDLKASDSIRVEILSNVGVQNQQVVLAGHQYDKYFEIIRLL